MLKKRSFMTAELDPPPLALPGAMVPERVKKQRSVRFGTIEVLGGAPAGVPMNMPAGAQTAIEAAGRDRVGAQLYSSIPVKSNQRGKPSPLELECCRGRLETLLIAAEAALVILETKRPVMS